MHSTGSQLNRFLRAVHRRQARLRIAESAAAGALAGCVAGAGVIALGWWRDLPSLGAVGGIIASGGIAGGAWGLLHRPSRLQAALESDRQLRLDDLLATAWLSAKSAGTNATLDPWAVTLLASAEATCARISPAMLSLRRWGGRAWGGLTLCVATVLSVAALVGGPAAGRGAKSNMDLAGESPADIAVTSIDRPLLAAAAPDSPRSTPQGPGHDPAGDRPGETPVDPGPSTAPEGSAIAEAPHSSSGGDRAGTTGGSSNAAPPPTLDPEMTARPPLPPIESARPTRDSVGVAKAGSGRTADARAAEQENASATAAGSTAPARATPPWRSDAWSDDRREAQAVIAAGKIPPAYRGLVRQYFERS